MTKYIDTEKLKAEIEKFSATEYGGITLEDDVANGALDYVLEEIIPSLQQDKETLELCSQVWWEDRGWIMIPPNVTLEGIDALLRQVKKKLKQEQPSLPSNLDEAAEKAIAEYVYNEGGPFPGTTGVSFINGFKAGAEWMANQVKQ